MRQAVRFICEECQREYVHPYQAQLCEARDLDICKERARRLLDERRWHSKGHDTWIEDGQMKHAKRVDPEAYGPHKFTQDGTSDCAYGCGCWMGPARSGGPVNPFGACPNHPRNEVAHQGDPCRFCGTPHDDVQPGPCPALVEAQKQ